MVNSTLESIVKEILKDERVKISLKGSETLYSLVGEVLKFFQLYPNSDIPKKNKTIGSSLLSISKEVKELRSSKTKFHGKTEEDYIVSDSIFTYFVVNSVSSVGLFLKNYFEKKFPPPIIIKDDGIDDLPF